MFTKYRVCTVLGLGLATVIALAACDALQNVGPLSAESPQALEASQARKNAERLIDTSPGKLLRIDLVQYDPTNVTQSRCDPLGLNGFVGWNSRLGGGVTLTPLKADTVGANPNGVQGEYDYLFGPSAETQIILGIRTPVEPQFPMSFSQIEFNLRAVNPRVYGHAGATPYINTALGNQADFPSNDDNTGLRSLIDRAGGDVAIVVRGLDFQGGPTSTTSTMNFLGPTGWVLFMRDNAYQSGRFYNLTGALKGGPRAFEDTPPAGDEGAFESAQVNGDGFDQNSERFDVNPLTYRFGPCIGAPIHPAPYSKAYSFLDHSNVNEVNAAGNGQGGFVLVVRRQAFGDAGVVVNPNVPGPAPAPINFNDVISPPISGYNEPVIPGINAADEDNFKGVGVAGVHEIGFSVFFTHGF
jgi:hypothetical protein